MKKRSFCNFVNEFNMKMNTQDISIENFDYPLPEQRIALHPTENRDDCLLMVRESDGRLADSKFNQIGDFLPTNSILVVNNTKVINARLKFRKGESGALIEIFCLEPVNPVDYERNFASRGECEWRCFVGNSKKWKNGKISLSLSLSDGGVVKLFAERVRKETNSSVIKFEWDRKELAFSEIISSAGEIPIPPYLNRKSETSDSIDYQTVYSRIDGSVAAPTAGLHFTKELFKALDDRGISKKEVTLHVGAGTFQPVKANRIGEHAMHTEFMSVDKGFIKDLLNTDRKIIAVGTTSVRTLESLYHLGRMVYEGRTPSELEQWYAYQGESNLSRKESLEQLLRYMDSSCCDVLTANTKILIAPGYDFKMVDGIITNFHQPKSTLLLLISAFIGNDWRKMYEHALENDYRFLSYGDSMLLLR